MPIDSQIIVALISTVGLVAVAWIGARKFAGPAQVKERTSAVLEEKDLAEARAEEWHARYDDEVLAHARTRQRATDCEDRLRARES